MNMSKIDMTQGSILGRAAQFALPICIGNILQQLYGTVDTLVIGNFCDASALAAVATSSQPLEILLCIFLGIGSGISILISQAAGASDADQLRKLAQTAVFFLYAASLPLTLLGVAAGPFLLRLMQVPADAMPYAIMYLRITTLGILGNMGYNFNAGILRGLGNSTSSLLFLGISCVTNIVLDLVLTAGLGMGVTGVAIATAASLFLSWMFSIFYIRHTYPAMNFPVFAHGFDLPILHEMLKIGLPLGLNTALYSVGHVLLQALYNILAVISWHFRLPILFSLTAGKVTSHTNCCLTVSVWIFSNIRHTYPAMNFPVFVHGFDLPYSSLPLGLNTALYSVGHVLLQALYNTLGSTFVAGCSVAGKVSGIANIAITSYSSAATVFAGQNLGARNYRRLCRGAWQIPLCSGIVTLAGGLLVTAFCHPLLMLFSRDPAVLAFAQRYTYLVLPFTWAYAVFNGIMCFINGIGEIRYPTIVNILLLWVVRIPAAYLIMYAGYGEYAMVSVSASFITGMIAMLFYFKSRRWGAICALAKKQEYPPLITDLPDS